MKEIHCMCMSNRLTACEDCVNCEYFLLDQCALGLDQHKQWEECPDIEYPRVAVNATHR